MPKPTDRFNSPPGVLVKDPDDGKYYYLIDGQRKPATNAQLRQLRRNTAYNRKLAQGKLGDLSDLLGIS